MSVLFVVLRKENNPSFSLDRRSWRLHPMGSIWQEMFYPVSLYSKLFSWKAGIKFKEKLSAHSQGTLGCSVQEKSWNLGFLRKIFENQKLFFAYQKSFVNAGCYN